MIVFSLLRPRSRGVQMCVYVCAGVRMCIFFLLFTIPCLTNVAKCTNENTQEKNHVFLFCHVIEMSFFDYMYSHAASAISNWPNWRPQDDNKCTFSYVRIEMRKHKITSSINIHSAPSRKFETITWPLPIGRQKTKKSAVCVCKCVFRPTQVQQRLLLTDPRLSSYWH